MTFQPGNPGGGRPKHDDSLSLRAREMCPAVLELWYKIASGKIKATIGERIKAGELIYNRAWGTPRQAVEVLGDGVTFVMRLPAPASSSEEWEQEAGKLNGRTV